MKIDAALLDTGPLVAFFDRSERFHEWSVSQFRRLSGPVFTCEPVIIEALFLLRRAPEAQRKLLGYVEDDVISLRFDLRDEIQSVRRLSEHYREVPMALADACLVRMAELFGHCPVLTFDGHFRIYRRNRRQQIHAIMPPGV